MSSNSSRSRDILIDPTWQLQQSSVDKKKAFLHDFQEKNSLKQNPYSSRYFISLG